MEEFKKELLDLGFNINSVGFVYWLDIYQIIKDNKLYNKKICYYLEVAKKNHTTYSKVERALRYAMEGAVENIKKKYNYEHGLRNSTFINIIKINLYKE